MDKNGLTGVAPISDDMRPVYDYELIEKYEGDGYALFRARGRAAFGRRIDGVFYALTDTDRIPLDWEPEIFAPIPAEQVASFFYGT